MSLLTRIARRLAGAAAVVAFAAVPAGAQITVFTAVLNGTSEVPPNASTASGSGTATLDQLLNTLLVSENWTGLTSNSTGAHIHCCSLPGVNSTVAVDFVSNGFPIGTMSGFYSHLFDLMSATTYGAGFLAANGGSVTNARNTVVNGMLAGQTYFNIHTGQFPGGEIRGQLVATVPEPATLGLFATGLLLLAGMKVRRRS